MNSIKYYVILNISQYDALALNKLTLYLSRSLLGNSARKRMHADNGLCIQIYAAIRPIVAGLLQTGHELEAYYQVF